jgi:4-amino-4-deoxy-L-arabinose transferase-like glycosyltransferase
MMEKEIEVELKKPEIVLLLISLLIFLYFILQATLPNPIVFGDEAFHVTLSEWMASNVEYPKYVPFEGTELTKTGNFRPLLWNLLLASFNYIFGVSDLISKTLTPLITFSLGLAAFVLVKRLYGKVAGLVAALVLISFPSVITYTVFFYYAALLLFFSSLSFLSFLVYAKENSKKFLILSSIFASLALLTNQEAIPLYGVFILYFAIKVLKERKLSYLKGILPAIVILAVIPLGYFVRTYGIYGTPLCSRIPFLSFNTKGCNIDNFQGKYNWTGQAVPTSTEQTVFSFGLINYLAFAYGNPFFVVLPFLIGFALIYYKRTQERIPIFIFFLFLILVFPQVSGRAEDASRYTLTWSVVFALLASLFYSEAYKKIESYNRFLPVAIVILVLYLTFTSVLATTSNLSQVKAAWKDFVTSCEKIDKILPKNATIYTVWGHNAAHSCNRNIASGIPDVLLSYNSLNYTLKVLNENKIDYIFIQKSSIDFQNKGYADNYPVAFVQMLESNEKNFKAVYEDGTSLQECLQSGNCNGSIVYQVIG